jgi:uncharacterized protein YjbI with pentapeptide repeats
VHVQSEPGNILINGWTICPDGSGNYVFTQPAVFNHPATYFSSAGPPGTDTRLYQNTGTPTKFKLMDLGAGQFTLVANFNGSLYPVVVQADGNLHWSASGDPTVFTSVLKLYVNGVVVPALQPDQVALYDACSYDPGGITYVFTADVRDLVPFIQLDGPFQSMRVPVGTPAALYAEPDYGGGAQFVTEDIPCFNGAFWQSLRTIPNREIVAATNECQNCDLSGVDLSNLDLSHGQFQGSTFTGANLSDSNFQFGNFTHANVNGANTALSGTSFLGADLRCTNFSGTNLTQATFQSADAAPTVADDFSCRVDLTGAAFNVDAFPYADWRYFNMTGAIVSGSNGALLSTTSNPLDLSGAMLSHAKLSGARLDGANFGCATTPGGASICTAMSDIDLHRASLKKAKLVNAPLQGANLNNANLDGANLCAARLNSSADTGGSALLQGAFLRNVNLSQSDLTGAIFDHANFYSSGNSSGTCSSTNCGPTTACASAESAVVHGTSFAGAWLGGTDFRRRLPAERQFLRRLPAGHELHQRQLERSHVRFAHELHRQLAAGREVQRRVVREGRDLHQRVRGLRLQRHGARATGREKPGVRRDHRRQQRLRAVHVRARIDAAHDQRNQRLSRRQHGPLRGHPMDIQRHRAASGLQPGLHLVVQAPRKERIMGKSTKSPPTALSRRDFLGYSAGAGLLMGAGGLFPNWAWGQAKKPSGRMESRTYYFNFSHIDTSIHDMVLVAGKQRVKLRNTTPAALKKARQDHAFLQVVPDNHLTHHVTLDMPADAVQLCYVQRVPRVRRGHTGGRWDMAMMLYHHPTSALREAHQRRLDMGLTAVPSKLRKYSVTHAMRVAMNDPVGEEALQDTNSHATALVAGYPELAAGEPDTAAHIQTNIIATQPATGVLGDVLEAQGAATPDGGWATQTPVIDDSTGQPFLNSQGQIQYVPVWSTLTGTFAGQAITPSLTSAKNDPSLGANITAIDPTAIVTNDPGAPTTGAIWAVHDGQASVDQGGTGLQAEAELQYQLTNQSPGHGYLRVDRGSGHQQRGPDHHHVRGEELVRALPVAVRALSDANDQPIPLSQIQGEIATTFPGWSPFNNGTYDARLDVLHPQWGGDRLAGEDGRAQAHARAAGRRRFRADPGRRPGQRLEPLSRHDPRRRGHDHDLQSRRAHAAAGPDGGGGLRPAHRIAAGLGNPARGAGRGGGAVRLVGAELRQHRSAGEIGVDVAYMFLSAGATKIDELIAASIAEGEEIQAVEDAIPIVGAFLSAIWAVGLIVDLVETSTEVASSPMTYVDTIRFTHDVQVTIQHAPDDPAGFPATATFYILTAKFDDGSPYKIRTEMPGTTVTEPIVETFGGVPAGGRVIVDVASTRRTTSSWAAAPSAQWRTTPPKPCSSSASSSPRSSCRWTRRRSTRTRK